MPQTARLLGLEHPSTQVRWKKFEILSEASKTAARQFLLKLLADAGYEVVRAKELPGSSYLETVGRVRGGWMDPVWYAARPLRGPERSCENCCARRKAQ